MSVIDPKELVQELLGAVQSPQHVEQLEEVLASLTDEHPAVVRHKATVKALKKEEKAAKPPSTPVKKSTTGSKSDS